MARVFQEHHHRQVIVLDGMWDFIFIGDNNPDTLDVHEFSYDDRMMVPGCFDATPQYTGVRGLVAYRKMIYIKDTSPHRLIFHGVNHWCRVFWNGKTLGDHIGGFTRFHFDIWDLDPGVHELVVVVDNRFDYDRCPLHLDYFDWYQYGGISRSVEIHNLGNTWIDELRINTEGIHPPVLSLAITYGSIAPLEEIKLNISWDGIDIIKEKVNLTGSSGVLMRTLQMPDAGLWSPDNPNLHLLHIVLGGDDIRERVGIRQIRADDSRLLINEEPIRLVGFNRHESHPIFGHSQPDALLTSDIQQLMDLGCNFIRGSHYPQDQRFLDLCDEVGICIMSEAIGWHHTSEHLNDPLFIQAQKHHITEMISSATNHASVIMWSLLNESHSHEEQNIPAYQELIEHIREADPTRPVTYASNHPFEDMCSELVDIISVNTYPGWYFGEISDIPTTLDRILNHLYKEFDEKKPVIISEIGAGAIPGWLDNNKGRWTEQYQARLIDIVIRHLFSEYQEVTGLSIWLYNDFRTNANVKRPRGFNNKGIVDEYRRPKMAYQVVKHLFQRLRFSTS